MNAPGKMRVGIIGYGVRGSGVTKQILASPMYEITALADTDKEACARMKQEPGLQNARIFTDYKEVLSLPEVEGVFVMAPQMFHKEISVDAFAAGKHVYCEKPMAVSVEDCDAMIEASGKAGRILMVGLQMRYHAHLKKMHSIILSGEIGKPVMLWLKEFRDPFPCTMGWAFARKNSGGLLVEKNCHHFDIFNWFSGSAPVRVFASGGQDVYAKPHGIDSDILDNAWVTVEYESGARALLGICMFAGMPSMKEGGRGIHVRDIGAVGEKGMVRTEGFDLGRSVEVRYVSGSEKAVYDQSRRYNMPCNCSLDGNQGILEMFFDCVSNGIQPETSGQAGKIAVALGLAAEKSAESRRVVSLAEVL